MSDLTREQIEAWRISFRRRFDEEKPELREAEALCDMALHACTPSGITLDLIACIREQQAALADLIDACDGNYAELVDECKFVLAKYALEPIEAYHSEKKDTPPGFPSYAKVSKDLFDAMQLLQRMSAVIDATPAEVYKDWAMGSPLALCEKYRALASNHTAPLSAPSAIGTTAQKFCDAHNALNLVDSLLAQGGYQPDSSARHNLAIAKSIFNAAEKGMTPRPEERFTDEEIKMEVVRLLTPELCPIMTHTVPVAAEIFPFAIALVRSLRMNGGR